MGASSMMALAGMSMFAMLVMAVVGILISALVLSVAFRLVVGHLPSYLRAIGTVVLTWLATLLAALVLGLLVPGGTVRLLGAVVMFLVGAAVINRQLRTTTGLSIGYGRACLVQLMYMVVGVVLALAFGLVMALLSASMLAGWR